MNKNYPGKVSTEQMIADHRAGMTIREIGAAYGISFQAVSLRFQSAGYDLAIHAHKRKSKKTPRICPTCQQPFIPATQRQIHCQMACARTENKPFCAKGHPITPQNLTAWTAGHPPRCRTCHYEAVQKSHRKRKEQA